MKIEHIARISLTPGRTAENQGHLTVGNGLFRKVVIDNEGRTAGIAEIFPDGGSGERSVILKGRRIGCGCSYYDRVIHRSLGAEGLDDVGDRRTFLADCHIDAIDRLSFQVAGPLVDDGVDRDGRLACLTVSDYQLTLAASDRDHGIDGLQACLERFRDRLAVNHPGSFTFQRHLSQLAANAAQAVERNTERIDNPAEHLFAHLD